MKLKSLLVSSFLIFGCTFASAQSTLNDDTKEFETEMALIKSECPDKQTFLDFYTAVLPASSNKSEIINALSQAYDAADANDASAASGLTDLIAKIKDILKKLGVSFTQIMEYANKLLPLYRYHMGITGQPDMDDLSKLTVDTVYATPADEAFYSIGSTKNNYNPYGLSEEEIKAAVADGARIKHNGAYAWGMTNWNGKLYWSTNNNYLCMQGYGNFVQPGKGDSSYENNCWVCEYGNSIWGVENYGAENAKYGDVRPPRIFQYDPETGVINDITPNGKGFEVLKNCQGLRSAGAHKGVVFFGGPALYGNDWISASGSAFAAYDADKGEFISACDMSSVDGCAVADVRRWIVYDDVLYVGVKIVKPDGVTCGAVLRWFGDKNDPWQFHIVGLTSAEAAEIAVFNNHMYAGTWGGPSHVAIGPEIPEGGLPQVSLDSKYWQQVWSVVDYEPTASVGRSVTSVAGFRVWRNHLYWGVFCPDFYIPMMAMQKFKTTDLTSADVLQYMLANYRTASFWRLDKDNNFELLYGETSNPELKTDSLGNTTVVFEENGLTPKFGHAGFGNFWDFYVWALYVYNDNLYIGTMDGSNLIGAVKNDDNPGAYDILGAMFRANESNYGYELLRMTDEEEAPKFITKNGFNNGAAYGIRNFDVIDDKLYVGTASPFNMSEYGGWHIHSIKDAGITTDIKQAKKAINPGIYMKNGGGFVTIATVGGEKIDNISITDLSGKQVYSVNPGSHEFTVNTTGMSSAAIVKVTSSKGSWTTKVTMK